MPQVLTFITGNANKSKQLSHYLGIPLDHQKLDLIEIQSLDLVEIITHKAREAYAQIKRPVIVDDFSLVISAMGQLPGPFVKYFLSELGTKGICDIVAGLNDTSARGSVHIGYCDGGDPLLFSGSISGHISQAPRGECGFGCDPILIPEGYTQTRGEMDEADYDATSPRRIALENLKRYLDKNLTR